jgi:hypothetical protein
LSAETDFRAVLAGYGPLASLVGARIAQNAVPPATAAPYVVFSGQHEPSRGLDNTLLGTKVTFSVTCWAKKTADADAVADQVVAALAAQGVECTARASDYDAEVDLDATALTVDWWVV